MCLSAKYLLSARESVPETLQEFVSRAAQGVTHGEASEAYCIVTPSGAREGVDTSQGGIVNCVRVYIAR